MIPRNNSHTSIKQRFSRFPKAVRILLISLAGVFVLLVIGWFVLNWYVQAHKDQILSQISAKISKNISGELQIADMEPALLKSFPDVSVRLMHVTLRDSLYRKYQKNTIDLSSVYIRLNLFSVFSRHPEIKKVTIADGHIYLFKQTNGYSNIYLFRKKDTSRKSRKELEFHQFGIEGVTLTFDNFLRNKQFKIKFNEMEGMIRPKEKIWTITAETEAHIFQLGFNLAKGGYLVNRKLSGTLQMTLNKATGTLELPRQPLQIGGVPIQLKAKFLFGEKPAAFQLDIHAPAINFQDGMHMLTPNIYHKLDSFRVRKNIDAHALIKGTFMYPDTPNVHVYIKVKNNTINTPYGKLTHVTMNPEFQNNIVPGKGMGDDNSGILINHFTGEWEGIPIIADSTLIYGLNHPLLILKAHSQFPIERLNTILGSAFNIKDGTAQLKISYHGPVTQKDTFQRNLNGYLSFKNASLSYLPRGLSFRNCSGTLFFNGEDMILRNIILSTPKSSITINGVSKKFLNAYFNDPSKAVFDWNLRSSFIDLNEFKSFLAPRRKYKPNRNETNRKIRKINRQIEALLARSTMHLDIEVQKVIYKKFEAKAINGHLTFAQSGIQLDDIRLKHAGGTVNADAMIHQKKNGNPFSLNAEVQNVQIDRLFYAFDNFGQETIDDRNIEGSFSADIKLRGVLSTTGSVIKNSFDGKVHFTLKNGELNNFPPFLTISKFIFKKRHLDHITFQTLSNELDIKNGKITIHPMEINSSAIRMKVQGVYALGRGTNISMEIPLRNPQKDIERKRRGLKPRKNKGIVLYLRAMDDDQGNVKISWDPFRKGQDDDQEVFSEEERAKHDSVDFQLPQNK